MKNEENFYEKQMQRLIDDCNDIILDYKVNEITIEELIIYLQEAIKFYQNEIH